VERERECTSYISLVWVGGGAPPSSWVVLSVLLLGADISLSLERESAAYMLLLSCY